MLANTSNLLEVEQSRELCSRMTDTVKSVGLSLTAALILESALGSETGLRTGFDEWHTLDRSWPFCHGVVAYLRIHARIDGFDV
jgi:hypothetical protein